MNGVRSEVLFNRALIWVVMVMLNDNLAVKVMSAAAAVYNFWKSFATWEGIE